MAQKAIIKTDRAPQAIGPYSQAVRCGPMLFVSGQIPIDPATGEVATGDIRRQTEQVLLNLQAIVEATGLSLSDVVKTTVFLKNLSDFQTMNEVYAAFFSKDPPARATVEVSNLPREVLVEIDAMACGGTKDP